MWTADFSLLRDAITGVAVVVVLLVLGGFALTMAAMFVWMWLQEFAGYLQDTAQRYRRR
jgi:asparagine N-glycosylation enzyme membrane subunit Stt3